MKRVPGPATEDSLIPIFRGKRGAAEYYGWQARALVDGDDPKYLREQGH